ncbi:hypothetical protein Peur_009384 [Populus x canadensis]
MMAFQGFPTRYLHAANAIPWLLMYSSTKILTSSTHNYASLYFKQNPSSTLSSDKVEWSIPFELKSRFLSFSNVRGQILQNDRGNWIFQCSPEQSVANGRLFFGGPDFRKHN